MRPCFQCLTTNNVAKSLMGKCQMLGIPTLFLKDMLFVNCHFGGHNSGSPGTIPVCMLAVSVKVLIAPLVPLRSVMMWMTNNTITLMVSRHVSWS